MSAPVPAGSIDAGAALARLGQQIGGLHVELAITQSRAEAAEAEVARLREQFVPKDEKDAEPARPDRPFPRVE